MWNGLRCVPCLPVATNKSSTYVASLCFVQYFVIHFQAGRQFMRTIWNRHTTSTLFYSLNKRKTRFPIEKQKFFFSSILFVYRPNLKNDSKQIWYECQLIWFAISHHTHIYTFYDSANWVELLCFIFILMWNILELVNVCVSIVHLKIHWNFFFFAFVYDICDDNYVGGRHTNTIMRFLSYFEFPKQKTISTKVAPILISFRICEQIKKKHVLSYRITIWRNRYTLRLGFVISKLPIHLTVSQNSTA